MMPRARYLQAVGGFLCPLLLFTATGVGAGVDETVQAVQDNLEVSPEELGSMSAPRVEGTTHEPDSSRFVDLFMPLRTEVAALSPDGRHLAFSSRQEDTLRVIIVAVDDPEHPLTNLLVATDKTSTPILQIQAEELVPARIDWMGWVTPERLVIQTNHTFAMSIREQWISATGAIYAVDLDGQNGKMLVTPMDLARLDDGYEAETERDNFAPLPGDALPFLEDPTLEPPDYSDTDPEYINDELPEFAERIPRSPQVVDYRSENPTEILVRGGPAEDFDLWALNVITGENADP